ncbi:MAG TPA: RNA methyltransferase [Erysipelotrichaceae bacterium]|nr:RNA methyltransferase [Erysipelotrichaceae bacterium]
MIHIVLFQPEIPQNTGNIMRTCAATNTRLHLIKPLGFKLDEKSVRRSGMDYRDMVEAEVYEDFEDFSAKNKGRYFFITRYGQKAPSDVKFQAVNEDIYLIFGRESTGIPKAILRPHIEDCLRLPMVADARSLNLSNTVAIVVYEVLRQLDYPGLSPVEVLKGEDWLSHD